MSDGERRHILLISGGKDSTALAIYMRDRYPEIEMEYLFTDTQKELPETYAFLNKLEAYLEKPIIRLGDVEGDRGFDHWLAMYGNYLPSPKMRWCTRKLKIEPFEKYVGDDEAYLYVAIRADENRRGFISTKPNLTPVYPFIEDGITRDDIGRILTESGVGLPEYYRWRSRSGCYFCFFQRKIEWIGLLENHPNLYEEAVKYEKPEKGYTWNVSESLEELRRPERIEQIRREDALRKEQARKRQRPKNLAQAFGILDMDIDDELGCLICHL
ncbi:MAG TPA: phosphoadenosine phosphosulfate reductase family protein [Firmicutes bacterium]|nr:phosphoadenosine phosphosulfate reductase family protein [Bacillota bacterium]